MLTIGLGSQRGRVQPDDRLQPHGGEVRPEDDEAEEEIPMHQDKCRHQSYASFVRGCVWAVRRGGGTAPQDRRLYVDFRGTTRQAGVSDRVSHPLGRQSRRPHRGTDIEYLLYCQESKSGTLRTVELSQDCQAPPEPTLKVRRAHAAAAGRKGPDPNRIGTFLFVGDAESFVRGVWVGEEEESLFVHGGGAECGVGGGGGGVVVGGGAEE